MDLATAAQPQSRYFPLYLHRTEQPRAECVRMAGLEDENQRGLGRQADIAAETS